MKSPTPYDFFYSFENVSGEDLSWLWKPWFFEFGYPDVKISELKGENLVVSKTGTKPVPLSVEITYKDGSTKRLSENSKVFSKSQSHSFKIPDHDKVSKIIVNKEIPDFTPFDNFYPSIGEIYSTYNIPWNAVGSYQLIEFPVTATVEKKEGAFLLKIPGASISTYLLPVTTTNFESLDGDMKIEFVMDGENCTGMKLSVFGYNLTSKKVK